MKRPSDILGLLAGAVMALSFLPHSLLGWPALRDQLAATGAGADLVAGVMIGWQFGGVAMLAFGLIVITTFVDRLRGERPPLLPVRSIALLYVLFGAWGLLVSGGSLFFLVFLLPGLLTGIAAHRPPAAATS